MPIFPAHPKKMSKVDAFEGKSLITIGISPELTT